MSLFHKGAFVSHSGLPLTWKIECDALTPDDWDCIASVVARKFQFRKAVGVPQGRLAFARALQQYVTPGTQLVLAVDDVLTTGASLAGLRETLEKEGSQVIGVVLFSRGYVPWWCYAVFGLADYFRERETQ